MRITISKCNCHQCIYIVFRCICWAPLMAVYCHILIVLKKILAITNFKKLIIESKNWSFMAAFITFFPNLSLLLFCIERGYCINTQKGREVYDSPKNGSSDNTQFGRGLAASCAISDSFTELYLEKFLSSQHPKKLTITVTSYCSLQCYRVLVNMLFYWKVGKGEILKETETGPLLDVKN